MRALPLRFQLSWPYAALAATLLAYLAAILILNGGYFVYTLDDSYIHLAFSEQLARGHFGLVAQEPASPSSSILYPLLLIPLSGTTLHQFQPLFWNLLAVFAALFLWLHLLRRFIPASPDNRSHVALSGIVALLIVLLLNHAGLAFSGMESGLQIALSLATAIGLIEFVAHNRLRWWLIFGIVAGPLIRYENLAVALPALAILAGFGRWRVASLCAAAIGAVLVGYAVYCQSIGLPPVPGSLLSKTGFDDPSIGWLEGIWGGIQRLIPIVAYGRSDLPILPLAGLLVLNFLLFPPRPERVRERALIGFALFVLSTQFVFGGHGSLGRYDIHAWSIALAVALYVNRRPLERFVALLGWRRATVAAIGVLVCLFPYSSFMALATPLAANDIYRQQFQMRRFLVDFAKTAAVVNDAGLTAYRNPHGILDVVGLGSEEARRLRRDGKLDAASLQRLAQARQAPFAMIYPAWLTRDQTASWTEIGRLQLQGMVVSVAGREVAIYALPGTDPTVLKEQLRAFAPTLPRRVVLQIAP